jgi:hypothetical protein
MPEIILIFEKNGKTERHLMKISPKSLVELRSYAWDVSKKLPLLHDFILYTGNQTINLNSLDGETNFLEKYQYAPKLEIHIVKGRNNSNVSSSAKKKQILDNTQFTQLNKSCLESPTRSPKDLILRSIVEKRTLERIQDTTEGNFQGSDTIKGGERSIYYSTVNGDPSLLNDIRSLNFQRESPLRAKNGAFAYEKNFEGVTGGSDVDFSTQSGTKTDGCAVYGSGTLDAGLNLYPPSYNQLESIYENKNKQLLSTNQTQFRMTSDPNFLKSPNDSLFYKPAPSPPTNCGKLQTQTQTEAPVNPNQDSEVNVLQNKIKNLEQKIHQSAIGSPPLGTVDKKILTPTKEIEYDTEKAGVKGLLEELTRERQRAKHAEIGFEKLRSQFLEDQKLKNDEKLSEMLAVKKEKQDLESEMEYLKKVQEFETDAKVLDLQSEVSELKKKLDANFQDGILGKYETQIDLLKKENSEKDKMISDSLGEISVLKNAKNKLEKS